MTGKELKAWRLKQGLSQEALARVLRVSTNTVYRWESEARRIPYSVDLAIRTLRPSKKK